MVGFSCYWRPVLLMAFLILDDDASADENVAKSDERAATLARLTNIVESYSISMGGESNEPLELIKPPVLHYSDQISPVTDGLVFVWTKAGRPEAVMGLHPGTQGHTWIEFKSLSQSPLTAVRNGRTEWRPRTPGVEFQPLPGTPAPDETEAKRLTQMRSLLRSFTASVQGPHIGRQQLRLLPQPLFRYAQPERGVLDGGLFAFVLSTNPELLLVVEVQVIEGKPQWVYSIARFTGRETELRLNDQPIWPSAELPSTRDSKEPFFQQRVLIFD
jgi:hypothetical protein